MYKAEREKTLDGSVILSRARQEEMLSKGWSLRHVETGETEQEAYDRISKANPSMIVRIYSATTAVKGYHDHYAMVRWPKAKKQPVSKRLKEAVEALGLTGTEIFSLRELEQIADLAHASQSEVLHWLRYGRWE